MPERKYTLHQVRAASKPVDSWSTVLFIDPIAQRIVWLLANFTSIRPNTITVLFLILTLGAAALYWQGSRASVIAGAIIFLIAFVLDCVDGKLARLKGSPTKLGERLDHLGDFIPSLLCIAALAGSFYRETGNWLGLLFGIIFAAYIIAGKLYMLIIKSRFTQLHVKGVVLWERKPEALTIPRLRQLRLRLLPSGPDAAMLLFVVFPLAGMILQGLLAGVIVVIIDCTAFIVENGFLVHRISEQPRRR